MTNGCRRAACRGALTALLLTAVLASCRHSDDAREGAGESAEKARPSAGARQPTNAVLSAGNAVSAGELGAPASGDGGSFIASTRRACRVMALAGSASVTSRGPDLSPSADADAPRPLARGDLLPEGGLIALAASSELTVQATVSTREITLVGPAVVEACPQGAEAVRLARGKVTAFPGAGVRPGAEVWVATPLGVLRFNDAKIAIEVLGDGADGLSVVVTTGQATLMPARAVVAADAPFSATREGPARADAAGSALSTAPRASPTRDGAAPLESDVIALAPGTSFEARRPPITPSRWVRDLVADCVQKAGLAREAGQNVAAARGGDRAKGGELAFAHVRARQRARAACESARAAALGTAWLDAKLRADLDAADERWNAAPPASSGTPSPLAPSSD